MSDFRKQAPGKPEDHPDWFFSLSGGIDSTAAYIVSRQALKARQNGGNFSKNPVAVYLDTGIGVPLNRIYVEQLVDHFGDMLWTLRTDESFEEWIESQGGAPGPGKHTSVRRRLKEKQVDKLSYVVDNPYMVVGIAADESGVRASYSKTEEYDNHVGVYPVHRLDKKERVEIILRSECPINPLWTHPRVITDCGCLANGDPSELDRTEELFPQFAQRLREYEESISHDSLRSNLGWGGLTSEQQEAVERSGNFEMCSAGCNVERKPAVVKALQAKAEGASVEDAVDVLYTSKDPEVGSDTLDAGVW
jgi:3'-phosphoadenosine 5'-phosphosulfate sulfotransferase (PAPS reductase)/FAD synthetase